MHMCAGARAGRVALLKHARGSDKRLELNGAPSSKAVAGEECSKENNEEAPAIGATELWRGSAGNGARAPVVLRGGWDAQFGGTTKIWVSDLRDLQKTL